MPERGRLAQLAERSRPAVAALGLLDIRTMRVNAEVLNPWIAPPYDVETALQGSYGFTHTNVGVRLNYEVSASAEDRVPVWRIALGVHLGYELVPGAAMPSEESIGGYAATTAPFMAHPYVRETVHSLTARMGVPPFLLPVMRSVADTALFGEPEVSHDVAGATPP